MRIVVAALALACLTVSSAAAAKTTGVTPEQCAQLRTAIATWGTAAVQIGARLRGYSDAQIAYARRACRV